MLRPIALAAVFGLSSCSISDDTRLTGLDEGQIVTLCAETCAGQEPWEIECDDGSSVSTDDDEDDCNEGCFDALESVEDCDKTAGDLRLAFSITGESTCEEAAEALGELFSIAVECTDDFAAEVDGGTECSFENDGTCDDPSGTGSCPAGTDLEDCA